MDFEPRRKSVSELLNPNNKYVLPKYQRAYKWGASEATELVDDLLGYMNADNNLFLGTLIFNTQSTKNISIVDGQQRLTTIILLLIACRQRARALALPTFSQKIQEKMTQTDEITGKSTGPLLEASDSIRLLFDFMVNSDWDGVFPAEIIQGGRKKPVGRQVNRIKPIYDYFTKQLSVFDEHQLQQFLNALYNAYAIRIDITEDVEALNIFERTNARGLDLEVSDLLKNYLFMKSVPNLEDNWEAITTNAEGNMLRLLKYFYVANSKPVRKADLYKRVKDWGREHGAENLVSSMHDFSMYYKLMRSTNSKETIAEYFSNKGVMQIASHERRLEMIEHAIAGLQLFKVVQFYPVLYSAIEALRRCQSDNLTDHAKGAERLVKMFQSLEKYHFINSAICTRPGNEVENFYAEYSGVFQKTQDFIATVDMFISDLADPSRLASLTEFNEHFSALELERGNESLIWYIFDRIENKGKEPAQFIKLYSPEKKWLKANYNIEHFFAQANAPDSHEDLLHNIGNLMIIYHKDNSRLGNLPPEEKINKLLSSMSNNINNLSHIKAFVERYKERIGDFSPNIITERAKQLATEAYQEVWNLSSDKKRKAA